MISVGEKPVLVPAVAAVAAICLTGFAGVDEAKAEWKPTKTVEFIVPAGTGGGADQMARMIQGIVQKHGLMEQSLVVVNKGGGSGGEGLLEIKDSSGEPHKIIITLSSLFTTPLATGIPFTWEEITPVAMLALDEFVLWVNADAPYQNAKEYLEAAKADGGFVMAGTGSKQEDQIITVGLEQSTGAKFKYTPQKGGGDVAKAVAGKHATSSVNNPIAAVSFCRTGRIKPRRFSSDDSCSNRSTRSWMRLLSSPMFLRNCARRSSGIGSCSSSAAPRIADSGLLISWVSVCTYSST